MALLWSNNIGDNLMSFQRIIVIQWVSTMMRAVFLRCRWALVHLGIMSCAHAYHYHVYPLHTSRVFRALALVWTSSLACHPSSGVRNTAHVCVCGRSCVCVCVCVCVDCSHCTPYTINTRIATITHKVVGLFYTTWVQWWRDVRGLCRDNAGMPWGLSDRWVALGSSIARYHFDD